MKMAGKKACQKEEGLFKYFLFQLVYTSLPGPNISSMENFMIYKSYPPFHNPMPCPYVYISPIENLFDWNQ